MPEYELPQGPAVKAASARLAGLRSRFKTAAALPATEREANYLEQTGRAELTPAQQRRQRKKLHKAGRPA